LDIFYLFNKQLFTIVIKVYKNKQIQIPINQKHKDMTEVISYRLNDTEALKSLASQKGITVSTLSSKIVENYLNYYHYIENYNFIAMPRTMLSELYAHVNPNNAQSIIDIATKIALSDLKLSYDNPSLTDVINYLHVWFDHNSFILKHFDKTDSFKLVCRHDINENWSKITSQILVEIFTRLGYQSKVLEVQDDNFSFQVEKNK
jgi:hypothetical protein